MATAWPDRLRRAADALLGAVLPESCPLCGRDLPPAATVCGGCVDALRLPDRYCERCSAPVGPYLVTRDGCGHCGRDRFAFEGVYALGVYQGRLRSAVLAAKRHGGGPAAAWLADRLWDRRGGELLAFGATAVAAVPQHWTRRLAAPHNAAELVGRRLAGRLKAPFDRPILRKIRRSPAQASLTPSDRRRNLRDAFRADPSAAGRRVLLVDDVLTTGTTCHRAARALLDAGAASVRVAVLARGIGE